MMERLVFLAMIGFNSTCSLPAWSQTLEKWGLWEAYAERFIAKDGRVIDRASADRTTSEGQAYALFFALVAGDQKRFERILTWTQANLAGGDLSARLPAWKWGKKKDGSWGILDKNSASDADLWFIYVLNEAGRLLCTEQYTVLAKKMAALVVKHEVATIPGLGPTLMPGRHGFTVDEKTWRLNPSYLPLFLVRRLVSAGLPGEWDKILESTVAMIKATARNGFIPDWVVYRAGVGFIDDPKFGTTGSYDAIRNYLWAGLLSGEDKHKALVDSKLSGPLRYWQARGKVPERVNVASGQPLPNGGHGPAGFYAVLLPRIKASGTDQERARLRGVMDYLRRDQMLGSPPHYYDQNLALFAEGFVDRRFQFMADGRLEPGRKPRCSKR